MNTIATMRLLGGRPALDLVNTVDARRDSWGPDLLESYADLLIWCERIALLRPAEMEDARVAALDAPTEADAVLGRAKTLREAIAGVFSAFIENRSVPSIPAASLTYEIDAARRHQTLALADDRFTWVWHDEAALETVLHRVALDAADLVTNPLLRARVKLCTGLNCGWLFLDETRNGSRRWCREEGCGTQTRMRRYRSKTR